MKRIELHTNSYYSDKLSFLFPEDIFSAKAAKECKAIAVTDHNSIFSYAKAERKAKNKGISLIYGLSLDCIDKDDRYAVTLLAKNVIGRENIYRIVSLLEDDACSVGKAITMAQLQQFREGLLVGASAIGGQLSRAIALRKSEAYLKKAAAFYDYIEIAPEPYDIGAKLMKLAKSCGITLCAVQNATMEGRAEPEEYHAFKAVAHYMAIDDQAEVFMPAKELEESFKELYILPGEQSLIEEALYNGPERVFAEIEEMPSICETMLNGSKSLHSESIHVLREAVYEALEKKYDGTPNQEAVERTQWELSKIEEYEAAEQFMLLKTAADLLRKNNFGYLLTGALASSFVLYLLGVNEFDPMQMGLWPAHLFYCRDNLLHPELWMSKAAKNALTKELNDIYGHKLITICEEMWDGLTEAELKDVLAQYTKDICGEEEGNKLSDNGLFYMAAQRRTGTKRKVRSVNYMLPDVGRWKQLPVTEDKDSGAICLQSGEFFPDLPSINTIPTDIFDILDICCRMEDMAYEEIPYESEELFNVLCKAHSGQLVPDMADAALTIMGDWEWLHHESLDFIEPRDLRSICRTRCLTHGTQLWENNQREMLYSNAMFAPDLICSREDVYKYLRARGVSEKTAADFMTDVRKGKIFSRGYTNEQYKMLDDCDAEYWFIEACEKIQYLFPEAHEVCFSVSMLRLLWLALNGSAAAKGAIIKYAAERER